MIGLSQKEEWLGASCPYSFDSLVSKREITWLIVQKLEFGLTYLPQAWPFFKLCCFGSFPPFKIHRCTFLFFFFFKFFLFPTWRVAIALHFLSNVNTVIYQSRINKKWPSSTTNWFLTNSYCCRCMEGNSQEYKVGNINSGTCYGKELFMWHLQKNKWNLGCRSMGN